jgi:hypothetical protein
MQDEGDNNEVTEHIKIYAYVITITSALLAELLPPCLPIKSFLSSDDLANHRLGWPDPGNSVNSRTDSENGTGSKDAYICALYHKFMSSNYVYSIRIREDVRRMMEEMSDINWQAEIRQMVEELVRERRKQRILVKAQERRKQMKNIGVGAAEMIREDRDAR